MCLRICTASMWHHEALLAADTQGCIVFLPDLATLTRGILSGYADLEPEIPRAHVEGQESRFEYIISLKFCLLAGNAPSHGHHRLEGSHLKAHGRLLGWALSTRRTVTWAHSWARNLHSW